MTTIAIYYSTRTDGAGRTSGIGDGITAPSSHLVATALSVRAAKAHIAGLEAKQACLMPGDGRTTPTYSYGPFNPRDYRGSQRNRDFFRREGGLEMIRSVARV